MRTKPRKRIVASHRYVRLRRTWIDVTSVASRREGAMLYRPGRWYLRFIPHLLGALAVFPWPGRTRFSDILPGVDLPDADFATIYVGNGSLRAKFTLKVRMRDGSTEIVKAARTPGGREAIEHEVEILKRLDGMDGRTPVFLGMERQGDWLIARQSALPTGRSPVRLQAEHLAFLDELKCLGLSHGDFAPWNCAIVKGQLVVWDWEEAGQYVEGKDASWFRKQVRDLLGKQEVGE